MHRQVGRRTMDDCRVVTHENFSLVCIRDEDIQIVCWHTNHRSLARHSRVIGKRTRGRMHATARIRGSV